MLTAGDLRPNITYGVIRSSQIYSESLQSEVKSYAHQTVLIRNLEIVPFVDAGARGIIDDQPHALG